MNENEEENKSLIINPIVEFSKNNSNTPSRPNIMQEWQLHIIPIKTQKSPNQDPSYDHLDPKNTERVIHSSDASEQTHKFVQNYISLNMDQVMESKIGPSGFYLKYLMTVAFLVQLMLVQIVSLVTFAFETPTYICTTSPVSADTFECTEN